MPYRYLDSSMPIQLSPKDVYQNDFQQILNEEFENSYDWYTIKEEYPYGSGNYRNIDVRINRAISAATSDKLGDDFKQILFKDTSYSSLRGNLYEFDDNYWIVINTEAIKNLASSVIVRRCNNMLRWIDSQGVLHSNPCVIENYAIRENRNYSTAGSAFVMPSGFIDLITQLNTSSNGIKANQRFLIGKPGSWTAYRLLGGGINNFNNLTTIGSEISGTLKLSLEVNYLSEMDDLVNGIPDVNINQYSIILSDTAISGIVGNQVALSAKILMNGSTVTRNIVWVSSDPAIASVNSSGIVTFISIGTCTITASLEGMSSLSASCVVNTVANPVDEYQVVINPASNFILEGMTKSYNVKLYNNGVEIESPFIFSIIPTGIPIENYIFTSIDSHNFSIENRKMYLYAPLTIRCTSAVDTKDIEILLKGAW